MISIPFRGALLISVLMFSTQACVLGGFTSRSTSSPLASSLSDCQESTMDRYEISNGTVTSSDGFALYFTASANAQLSSIELVIETGGATSMTVDLYDYTAGDPDSGTLLESSVVNDLPGTFEWKKIELSGSTSVSSGNLYSIVARPTGGTIRWRSDTGAGYASGGVWFHSGAAWVVDTQSFSFKVNRCN